MHNQSFSLLALLLSSGVLITAAHAEQPYGDKTFYTILTPDGPMQVEMPVPSSRLPAQPILPSVPATPPRPPSRTDVADAAPVSATQSAAVPSATAQASTTQPVTPPTTEASPFFEFGGQQYVDTAYLEQREFNLEGKKRFYSVPDGLGGTQVLERESGVRLSSITEPVAPQQSISLASSYRRVTANALANLTNQQCLSVQQLKTAKPLQDKPVDFWPRPGFEPKFEFVLAQLDSSLQNIHLMSYASTTRDSSYYWPLPIFLDQQGCILEGVSGFYQSKTAATWLQQSALQGRLHVPKDARYLLLTPLVEAAELSGETLADRGQLRLTPLRMAAP